MPEGPEVESSRRLVHRHCIGKKIVRVQSADDDKILSDGLNKAQLESLLLGNTITDTGRKGKVMWVSLEREGQGTGWRHVLFHHGMTGSFVVEGQGAMKYKAFEVDASTWPPRFVKLEVEFDDGTKLAFVDSRRFGKVWARSDASLLTSDPLKSLGFDPSYEMPSLGDFAAALRARKTAVKAVLLDQGFSAGIGNWVADEVLYQAKLHPEVSAAALSNSQVTSLHQAIIYVFKTALEANADSGEFPKEWLFHYRWTNKKASKDFHGHPIEFLTVGSRTSAVVPAVQKKTEGSAAGAGGGGKKKKETANKAKAKAEEEEEGPSGPSSRGEGGKGRGKAKGGVSVGGARKGAGKRNGRKVAAAVEEIIVEDVEEEVIVEEAEGEPAGAKRGGGARKRKAEQGTKPTDQPAKRASGRRRGGPSQA